MNALTEEAVLPTLHNLILAEVYLSGGPVDVFRLWSEMYERQKTIDVGTLLFVRAIAHLEQQGFLQKVSESKSAITGKGEAYLASTGNILDVAPQGENDSRSECSLYQALNTGKGVTESSPVNLLARGRGAVPSDSQILDRHGDDRFADNIQRALEGLPQNGDAEEEEDAAEEGAAIEASNLPDPQFESNGRY